MTSQSCIVSPDLTLKIQILSIRGVRKPKYSYSETYQTYKEQGQWKREQES